MRLSWLSRPRPAAPRRDVPAAYGHLVHLQALADEHGDRAAGTSGYEAAARYVEDQLTDCGYRTRRQYFTVKDRGRSIETFNILAQTVPAPADHVVMLGAHLDGVPGSPAINDNGSGVAALLEVARTVSRREGLNRAVRFAWWGAEEFSKSYGSRHYVKDLVKNDRAELDRIDAYLNFDMIASPNPVIGVYDARDTEPIHPVTAGSTRIMDVFTDFFDSRRQPWIPTDWDYDSDQIAFVKKGVAAGGLYTGDSDRKTAKEARLFGGRAGRPCDPHYHRPGDDLGNVNPDVLGLMTEAITHAAIRLAT